MAPIHQACIAASIALPSSHLQVPVIPPTVLHVKSPIRLPHSDRHFQIEPQLIDKVWSFPEIFDCSKPFRTFVSFSSPSVTTTMMEMTPGSTRSPTPPYKYTSGHQQVYEYPSPAQSEPRRYQSTDSLQGLGIYSCAISDTEHGVNTMPSPPATNNWHTDHLHHDDSRSAQSTPNVLSAEFDPFAPFHSAVSAAYSNDIYSTHRAEVSILPGSPLPTGNLSQRSSFSSAPTSEICTRSDSSHSYDSRIKMEDRPGYVSGHDDMLMSSTLNNNLLGTMAGSYPGSLEFYHANAALGWPKVDYISHELPSVSSLPLLSYERRPGTQEKSQTARRPSTLARTRQPRRLTTKEDANFQCNVKGCGKLFGRSYNYKAHMETHDAGREYPFPCLIKDCSKKFVRKTDLQRHHQSVHMKQRNHRCDFCSRFFARKDTLRRLVPLTLGATCLNL